jgi:AraC-like DNA-binding protein
MLTRDYLTLRLVRLKRAEEWSDERCGLAFVFPNGGYGKYVSGSVAQRLAPGDVLVTSAASGGKIGVPTAGEMVFWCFSVCLENLFPLFATNEICLLQSVLDGFKDAKFHPASSPLALECHRLLSDVPPQADLAHRGQLLRIVAATLSGEFKSAHRQRVGFVRAEEHLIQVFENLSPAEILHLSIGELAVRFSCSRRHLGRLFHQYFGLSVAALRMEMRLLKAVSLLRNPDLKVINVAEDCGFNHLGLFNTCFRRRFGASPGQWRKSNGQTEGKSPDSPDPNSICPLRPKGLCPWIGNSSDPDSSAPPKTISVGVKVVLKKPAGRQPAVGAVIRSFPGALSERPLTRTPHRASA